VWVKCRKSTAEQRHRGGGERVGGGGKNRGGELILGGPKMFLGVWTFQKGNAIQKKKKGGQ